MKQTITKQRIFFYLWTGLAYLLLWVIGHLFKFPDHFIARFVNNIWRALYVTAVNFVFFEFYLEYIWRRKGFIVVTIVIAIFLFWVFLMLCSYGLYGWRLLGVALGIWTPLIEFKSLEEGLESQAGYGIPSLIFFAVVRHVYNYIRLKKSTEQLRIEKQQAELNYLKSQTNPHFLFNTLNNIYSLARDKSDLAPESILRLSKILRFMLYETGGQFIAVEQEVKIIADYIELEKLRYDESLRINFNHDIEDARQAVPPLLLIPLVENAFKHGVSETRGLPFVDIHLSVKLRQLLFIVKNSSESEGGPIKENIGLSNLRRQLELLYTDYQLSVEQGAGVFTSILKINLGSHV
jgi:two-component system, LytTR family, sensor kinase